MAWLLGMFLLLGAGIGTNVDEAGPAPTDSKADEISLNAGGGGFPK